MYSIISTCYLDLLVFQSLFKTWHKISQVPHIRGWAGGWMGWGGRWAKAAFQTQWDHLLCQMSHQWSPDRTKRQSRPSGNSHGQLGEDSHQCHLIKALQALLQCFHSSTGPQKSRLEKQTWLSIATLL